MIERLVPTSRRGFKLPSAIFRTGVKMTGTANPGVFSVGKYFQIAAEAIIPINHASEKSVGWVVGIDFYLHSLFADSRLGRPLFS